MPKPGEILSPVEAGALFLSSSEFRFRIFCPECGGWVSWVLNAEACPACGRSNGEAAALNIGVSQARANLAPTEIREGKQT